MNENKYRLGEHCILEYDKILLSWEKHAALGDQCSGKCFICGDILIVGPCTHRESGYLIGEFLDQLRKLPPWDKTGYYCFASSLLDVYSGQGITTDFLERHQFSDIINYARPNSAISLEQGTFRLGRYRLAVDDNCRVSWETYEGLNRIAGGQCIIESKILFIDKQDHDAEGQSKQEFLRELSHLPQWDKTFAWGHREVLRACPQATGAESPRITFRPKETTRPLFSEKRPAAAYKTQYKEIIARLISSGSSALKAFCRRAHEGKMWLKYLIALLVIALLFVLAIFLSSADKIFHKSHRDKEHHHEHDD